jgi:hypothetical protein
VDPDKVSMEHLRSLDVAVQYLLEALWGHTIY